MTSFASTFLKKQAVSRYYYAILTASYYLIWLLPRLPAISANSIHFDDFNLYAIALESTICSVPPQDYRWIGIGLLCALENILPDWSIMVWPKLLAGLFLAMLAVLLSHLLMKWSVPILVALLAPVLFISHPILNEISLWNTTMPFPLWLLLTVLGYVLVDLDRPRWQRVSGFMFMVTVVLAYEIYLSCFLVLVFAEAAFRRLDGKSIDWLNVKNRLLLFFIVALFYVIQVLLTKWLFGVVTGRGLVDITSLSSYLDTKLHGIFNLVVNCYMPLISYYTGIEFAWGAWKWIPLLMSGLIVVFGILARRSVIDLLTLLGFSLVMPVVPTLPLLLASQSPESWRVSVPVLLAIFLLAVLLMTLIWQAGTRWTGNGRLATASKALVLIAMLGIMIIEMPSTYAEARLRAFENQADSGLADTIAGYWLARGLDKNDYSVGVITGLGLPTNIPDEHKRASQLSVAYGQRGVTSAFLHDFSWRGFLMLHDFKTIEVNDVEEGISEACARQLKHCRPYLKEHFSARCKDSPDFTHPGNGLRLVHEVTEKVTVVCR